MRPAWRNGAALAVAGAMLALAQAWGPPAWGQQRSPIQSAPLPPLQQQQWQQNTGPGNQDQAPPSFQPSQPPAAMEQPNVWLPAQTAKLQALDKVNAQATPLTIKVGQSAALGSLTITVKACVVRPSDQPADAAAFLDVTDSHADSPGFKGWMLQTEPAVSMMQHPIYDLRVMGCA
jgi:hypothetical protein